MVKDHARAGAPCRDSRRARPEQSRRASPFSAGRHASHPFSQAALAQRARREGPREQRLEPARAGRRGGSRSGEPNSSDVKRGFAVQLSCCVRREQANAALLLADRGASAFCEKTAKMDVRQRRMARAALEWTQLDLAAAAGVSWRTVARFEGGESVLPARVQKIRSALEWWRPLRRHREFASAVVPPKD